MDWLAEAKPTNFYQSLLRYFPKDQCQTGCYLLKMFHTPKLLQIKKDSPFDKSKVQIKIVLMLMKTWRKGHICTLHHQFFPSKQQYKLLPQSLYQVRPRKQTLKRTLCFKNRHNFQPKDNDDPFLECIICTPSSDEIWVVVHTHTLGSKKILCTIFSFLLLNLVSFNAEMINLALKRLGHTRDKRS